MTGPKSTAAQVHERLFKGKPSNYVVGSESRLSRGASKAMYGPMAHILGAPIKGIGGLVGDAAFGMRNRNPLSPVYGKRLAKVPGGKPGEALSEISRAEYNSLRKAKGAPKVIKARIGGKTLFYQQRYRPGGLVGFAQKHPLMAGGGALLAYYLSKNPQARQMAQSQAGSLMPQQAPPDPRLAREWGALPQTNAFARGTWG